MAAASAAALPFGGLQVIDISECPFGPVNYAAHELAQQHAASLRELKLGYLDSRECEEMLPFLRTAPPLLTNLECGLQLRCGYESSAVILEMASVAAVHVQGVHVISRQCYDQAMVPAADASACLRFMDATPMFATLRRLHLAQTPCGEQEFLEEVVEFCLRRRLTSLSLSNGTLDGGSLPLLSRLPREGELHTFTVVDAPDRRQAGPPFPLLDGPPEPVAHFAAALRASRLKSLRMRGVQLWASPVNAQAVMGALTGHPTLQSLSISFNALPGGQGAEAAKATATELLVALLRADAPALRSLRIKNCRPFDYSVLGPVFQALRCNTHLAALECAQHDRGVFTKAQVEKEILPALHENQSLRRLGWDGGACAGAKTEERFRDVLEARPDREAFLAGLPRSSLIDDSVPSGQVGFVYSRFRYLSSSIRRSNKQASVAARSRLRVERSVAVSGRHEPRAPL